MSREIYTYIDLPSLKYNKDFLKIMHYPIVTAISDSKKVFIGDNKYDVNGMFSNDKEMIVTDIRALVKSVDSNWATDQSKFAELLLLFEFIHNLQEKTKDENELLWLKGCRRNSYSLLSTILLLEQANVKPEEIPAYGDRNIDLMVQAWKYVRENDKEILHFSEVMEGFKSKQDWNSALKQAFKNDVDFTKFDTIVFQGFYYITPIQERIINLLEIAGYKIIMLIPYDKKYPFVYEIWNMIFSEENGYPSMSDWHMQNSEEENPFGELFTGNKKIEIKNKIEIFEYSSEMEFVNAVRKINSNNYAIYSSDYLNANKLLRDYYPEAYGDRRVLSYPIGQFISTLNTMWDEDEQDIILNNDKLIDCFASGWLSYNGKSGKEYIQDLMYLLPFFAGCKRISEWESRIDKLNQIHEEIVKPTTSDLDCDEQIARWQEIIGNPLASFSMFSVEQDKMEIILALIKQLLGISKELFGIGKQVYISEHVHKMDYILRQHEVSNELYEEEREIVVEIFENLSESNTFDIKCAPSDISRALDIYMSGKFEEGEIQTDKLGLIVPLFYVDAASLKGQSKIHICMTDISNMPGGNKEYVWPLTGAVVKDIYMKTQNSLLRNMINIMESTVACNRYFMYVALNNEDVEISWISNMGDKKLAPSPYIKLLHDLCGIEIIPSKRNSISYNAVQDATIGKGRIAEYKKKKAPVGMPKETRIDYAFCPTKYMMGYVLEKKPVYQSAFQQNYSLNALISALYSLVKGQGITKEQIYRNVMDLFPSLRMVEKRQIFDYINAEERNDEWKFSDRTQCGVYFYTNERIKIQYPDVDVRDLAMKRYAILNTPDGRDGLDLYEEMKYKSTEEKASNCSPADACTFCPHIDYCRNAVRPLDKEQYYD